MADSRKTYSSEYKKRLVELVRAGRSPEELAKEFEPAPGTIRKWATQADIDEGWRAEGLPTAERAALPRASWISEIDRQVRVDAKLFVLRHPRSLVPC